MFQDKVLTCRDCGQQFVFSASEQQFYADKGFQNDPSRCLPCRQARKAANGEKFLRQARQMYPAVCARCGIQTEVPFRPAGDRPVYCRTCYQRVRSV